jgi:hypothetical protein
VATGTVFLQKLDLTDVAANTLVEVDLRTANRTRGTLLFAYLAVVTLLDATDAIEGDE